MRTSRASIRYAKALFQHSVEKGALESTHQDMKTLSANSHDDVFKKFLNSPVIKLDQKKDLIKTSFSNSFCELSNTFIDMVISNGRANLIPEIALKFEQEYKRHHQIITAEVTTSVVLDDETRKTVIRKINPSGKQVDLIEKIDPTILGGFVIKIGDRLIDESIKKHLTHLRYEFSQNLYESKL